MSKNWLAVVLGATALLVLPGVETGEAILGAAGLLRCARNEATRVAYPVLRINGLAADDSIPRLPQSQEPTSAAGVCPLRYVPCPSAVPLLYASSPGTKQRMK